MGAPDRSVDAEGALPIAVIKLGGSVLTRKREEEKLRPKVLSRLAREISELEGHRVVLLHGAGGFGHPGAARFGLATPPSTEHPGSERGRGAAIVAAEVRRLHLAVLRELVSAGARPWSVPAANHAQQQAGKLVSLDTAPFARALEGGYLPVSFGDVVPDSSWGSSILSADQIALALALALRPSVVLFVSDVNGIYAPGGSGRPIPVRRVTDSLIESLEAEPGSSDVTGGIRGKAEAMRAIAQLGVDAGLISGLSDGAISRALRGKGQYGSWALAGEPGDAP